MPILELEEPSVNKVVKFLPLVELVLSWRKEINKQSNKYYNFM